MARRQRQSHSDLRPGDHPREPERARVHPRSVSRQHRFRSTASARSPGTCCSWRPCGPISRVSATTSSTRRATRSTPIPGTNSASSSITTSRTRIASDSCSTGARCSSCPRAAGPSGGLPVPLNNFRDEDSHTYVFRANWDRVITPTLLNRVTFGHNNWWQLRASFNRDQGWGTRIGLRNVPGPDLLFPLIDFSNDYLDWGRSEWGGSGQLSLGCERRPDVGEGETHVEDRVHLPGGPLRRVRVAHGGRHLQLQPRRDRGFLPNGNLDTTGATGNAFASFLLGEVQSSDITTNRYVSDRWRYYSGYAQDDWRLNNKLTFNYGVRYEYTPPTFEGHYPGRVFELQPEPAESCGRRPSRRVRVRRHRTGPNGEADDVRRVAVGFQPATRCRLLREQRDGRALERLAHLRVRQEHRRQLALERLHRRLQRDRARVSGQLRVQLGRRLAGVAGAAVPRAGNTQRQQHPVLAAGRLGPPSGVLLLDAQRAAPAARPVRRGGGLQRAARTSPHGQPAQSESDRPRDLLRLRPAVRARRAPSIS